MKKYLIIICLTICFVTLVSCNKTKKNKYPTNEIETYRKIDESKDHLVVSYTGNIQLKIQELCTAFEMKYPNVQIILKDITGGTDNVKPYLDWLTNGVAPDIMFIATTQSFEREYMPFIVDLSNKSYVNNFQDEALMNLSIDGRIYSLPGPSEMDCIIYNKTLFDNYGWKVPKTVDEFIALCKQITLDTDGAIEPWNPNAKYGNELNKTFQAFVYAELFAGLENRTWYNEFINNKTLYSNHMKPLYDIAEEMANENIIKESHFSYSATKRWNEFLAGNIAMVNVAVRNNFPNSSYEFAFMPFPTTKGDLGYVTGSIGSSVFMTKRNRTEKEETIAHQFLEFYSSIEAQQILTKNTLSISNVKNMPNIEDPLMSSLNDVIKEGHLFTLIEFGSEEYKPNFYIANDISQIVKKEDTIDNILARIDANGMIVNNDIIPPKPIAHAIENFTILETSNYIADLFKEKSNSEISLIANNQAYRGNLMRIFAGDIIEGDIKTLLPRSYDNNSKLIKVSMTGRQLLNALNNPVDNGHVGDCIYAFAGLKCTVAPWNAQGKRMLSVTLANGEKIDEDKLYTVSFWEGTVSDEYISEVLEKYDDSFESMLKEKIVREQQIAPSKDGRITLVWE